MTISPVDFASLLCSRLCHDLLSPVGALTNGLELLADEDDPAMRQRCLDLIAESARTSANKLKFFRLAFGAAGGFGETVESAEARRALEGLYAENRRLEIGWLVTEPMLPKPAAKVLLNLAMIAADSLVRGGQLDIGAEHEGGQVEIVLRGEGPRMVLDGEMRSALLGEGEEIGSRAAAAYLVREIVAGAGGTVRIDTPADGVVLIGATLKAE